MTPLVSATLLRTQSDGRLVGLASTGSERAFEAIVERYRKPLYRWCRRVLPDARAEDAVQTTFLKAWTALESGTEVDELKPWLYRIARNAALDNARKAGYDYAELTEALRVTDGPEAEIERRRVIRDTLSGVAGLPENQRQALLRTASGHSRADIARELEVSEGAVRQLVHRARTSLRAAATALTPTPLVSWACAMGADGGGAGAQRISELAAGAGSAGLASAAVKAGTVIVAAGVLAAGPGSDLRKEVAKDSSASAASAAADHSGGASGGADFAADDRIGRSGRREAEPGDDHGGRGRGESSGKGKSGDDNSGHGSSGSDDNSGSGSSGSGSSGSSGPSGSGDSGSGSTGSGSNGSGSGSSGSGSSGSGSTGSGSSGSGSSGSGSTGSGSTGSGSSGSGSSGSGGGSGSGHSGSGKSGDDD